MNDAFVGRTFRAVRVRLGKRQTDVADRAGVSRQLVSRIECGHLGDVSWRALRSVANELGIHLVLEARWRGGELDRMMNRRHAAMHEAGLAMYSRYPRWATLSEVTFNVRGERGVIDLLAWNEDHRALAINELKSEFVDPGELVGTMDRRRRLALEIARSRGWDPVVIGIWVIADDTRRNRRHLAAARRLLRGAFPADGHAMRAWLRRPTASIAGLSFLPSFHPPGTGQRVRTRSGRGALEKAHPSTQRPPGGHQPREPDRDASESPGSERRSGARAPSARRTPQRG